MKFKEQKGNVFVFDGGSAGGELELLEYNKYDGLFYIFMGNIMMTKQLEVGFVEDRSSAKFSDIQTAVNLMQILIEEGLV